LTLGDLPFAVPEARAVFIELPNGLDGPDPPVPPSCGMLERPPKESWVVAPDQRRPSAMGRFRSKGEQS